MPTASLSAQIGMKESRQTVAFLIKLDWGGSTLLCEGCDRLLASALEALTEPPLGELCAVPLALVPVQRAGRTTLELLVKRCDMTGEAYTYQPAGLRSSTTLRSFSCPRRSGIGTFPSVSPPSHLVDKKEKMHSGLGWSLCAFNISGHAFTLAFHGILDFFAKKRYTSMNIVLAGSV